MKLIKLSPLLVIILAGCSSGYHISDEQYTTYVSAGIWGEVCLSGYESTIYFEKLRAISKNYNGNSKTARKHYDRVLASTDISEIDCSDTMKEAAFNYIDSWINALNVRRYQDQLAMQESLNELSQLGAQMNAQGNQALRSVNSMSMPSINVPAVGGGSYNHYETMPNTQNTLSTFQTYLYQDTSSSGRTVCHYSQGATRILDYGYTICDYSIN